MSGDVSWCAGPCRSKSSTTTLKCSSGGGPRGDHLFFFDGRFYGYHHDLDINTLADGDRGGEESGVMVGNLFVEHPRGVYVTGNPVWICSLEAQPRWSWNYGRWVNAWCIDGGGASPPPWIETPAQYQAHLGERRPRLRSSSMHRSSILEELFDPDHFDRDAVNAAIAEWEPFSGW